MGVDPIFWDIAQMSENKNKAITFRTWGAFKTDSIYFKMNDPIAKNVKTTVEVVNSFVQWATQESELVVNSLKQKPFSQLLHQHLNTRGAAAYAEDLICALIDEEKNVEALEVARKFAPSAFQRLSADGNFNDLVNFYELAILHLAGRPAFRDEVLKHSVPFDTEKLPVCFAICHLPFAILTATRSFKTLKKRYAPTQLSHRWMSKSD